jgi:hypothetical protein
MKIFITILIAILSTSCFYNEKEENTIDEISAATNKVSTTNKIPTLEKPKEWALIMTSAIKESLLTVTLFVFMQRLL